MVTLHNLLAIILVANGGGAVLAPGQRPDPPVHPPAAAGFFDQAIVQAKFYLQGIFKDKEHPFEKSYRKKLNPLQQISYFGLLNVLLPLQIITGAVMWGMQQWPQIALTAGRPTLPGPVPHADRLAAGHLLSSPTSTDTLQEAKQLLRMVHRLYANGKLR